MPGDSNDAILYLDLMKRVLTDSIYLDDPLAFYEPYRPGSKTNPVERLAFAALQTLIGSRKMQVVVPAPNTPRPDEVPTTEERDAWREGGLDWPVRAHTMIGMKRLNNLQYCAETVLRGGVPGDFIETGVWRGGACILLRAILKAYSDTGRTVWVADSFEGLPSPSTTAYPADAASRFHNYSPWLACSLEQVQGHFRRYGLLDDQVRFLKGWFKDTLPSAPVQRLAILRMDGDMYESTIQALDALYDKLSPGGFVIVDDYALEPCAAAVHDFRARRGVTDAIQEIDSMGVFWRRAR